MFVVTIVEILSPITDCFLVKTSMPFESTHSAVTLYIFVVKGMSKIASLTDPLESVVYESLIILPDKWANVTFQFCLGPPEKTPEIVIVCNSDDPMLLRNVER